MALIRRWCRLLAAGLAGAAAAAVPQGWQWTERFPFGDIEVTASSEDPERWPAARAVDGDTSEPDGIWQTRRDSPASAWLELRLRQPRRLRAVRIYHQDDPRYYRSVEYKVLCRTGDRWQTVADVQGNRQAGWREHPFEPLEASAVRIEITRSEYGYRMGLNEVELVSEAGGGGPRTHLSEPHRCGRVRDLGVITFEADLPPGTGLAVSTRTAPDAGGRPGAWSDWSEPYAASGAPVSSPLGEWVQYRAVCSGTAGAEPVLRRVTIGSPECLERVDADTILLPPGKPVTLTLRFNRRMDTGTPPSGEVVLGGGPAVDLGPGQWSEDGRSWRSGPLQPGPGEGKARVTVGGAVTASGQLMMPAEDTLLVGDSLVMGRLRRVADWMMANEQSAIFVEGYNERTLLALYEITGDGRYLEHVRRWARKLLDLQLPAGYWGTGYGDVYFADTGSALGLLINLYKFADAEERARIDAAMGRYLDLLLVRGDRTGKPFVHEDGSLGTGFTADRDGTIRGDLNRPYTIATALTGAEIFAAWHYIKGDDRHRRIAVRACDWILDTMAGDPPPDPWAAPGQIPYIIEDTNPGLKDRYDLWKRWPYDTAAYVGEGFIAAWTYVDDAQFRERLARRVRPHIEWLLRTQNADGSWAAKGSGDQHRSHGVVNVLVWFHERIERDPRAAAAVRRYAALLLDEERSAYLQVPGNGIATSLAGRALAEIVRPGVDCCRWKEEPMRRE